MKKNSFDLFCALNDYPGNLFSMQNKFYRKMEEVKSSERGDTNFISMLLIVGIVVVLAGLFLTLGKSVMTQISNKITTFLNGL